MTAGEERPVLYRVRTPEGELDYPSMGDLARAFSSGLVTQDDDVFDVKAGVWKKARSFSALVRSGMKRSPLAQAGSTAAAVALAVAALVLLTRPSWGMRLLGLTLALAVSSLLTRVTFTAYRRSKGPR